MSKVLFTVYTEYQLTLALNEIFINKIYDPNTDKITLVIKHEKLHNRMDRPFEFDGLGIEIIHFNDDLDYKRSLSKDTKEFIDSVLQIKWDTFILFQENDALNCLLTYQLMKKGAKVCLYQDGLKAYNPMKSRSYGQLKTELEMRIWWRKNGYKSDPLLNAIHSHKYGFLVGVSRIHVTFPENYFNWNRKKVCKIEIEKSDKLFDLMKTVFQLENFILNKVDDTVFIISQSMRDDNSFERMLVEYLVASFANKKIYLKAHPINYKPYKDFIEEVKKKFAGKIEVIDEKVPAEFLIMQLKNSIVVSTISTSMFLNNPDCTFYYTLELAKHHISRFNRYNTSNPTTHSRSVNSLEEISF